MNVAITGGAGFLGRRLAAALSKDPRVERILLVDVVPFRESGGDRRITFLQGDLSEPDTARAVAKGTDAIYHLAACVSGQAESDLDLGLKVNVDGTRSILDAARRCGHAPRFVFASSLAVYGPPFPEAVSEETAVRPMSSYGAQKAVGELLIGDYTRRGYIDGRVLRLATVCVRPGRPNGAASSFVSGIIREPLRRERALCPVDRGLGLWLSSPDTTIANVALAGALPAGHFGTSRTVNLPGITVSVGEMIDCLERSAGPETASLIEFKEDPAIRRIVSSWPARFDVSRALALGFSRDASFESLIRQFRDSEERPVVG